MEKGREYGIDFIRIYAMCLVIMGHIIGRGGVLTATPLGSTEHNIALFLKIFSLCSINIFGLISGYVGYGVKFNFFHIIKLWIQILFWTVLIALFFVVARGIPIHFDLVRITFLPITTKTYWYMTAYFIAYLLSPLINIFVKRTNDIILFGGAICMLFTVSVILTTSGNNAIWLCVLYFIGAIIRKIDIKKKSYIKIGVCGYLFCVVFTWLAAISKEAGTAVWNKFLWAIFGGRYDGIWPSSITMLLAALFILLVGMNIKLNSNATIIIKIITPSILSIYLIHVHPLIFDELADVFSFMEDYTGLGIIGTTIGAVCFIFIGCIFLDFGRRKLFTYVDKVVAERRGRKSISN